ncbi:hypothetical protein PPERSA_00295 [Pseudocohnilembus persalinus]|uniref:Uncharacterized protein n=1 Tax=Pseudocohnilembus persalinus TaxID=266149 RepID=A0A0V0Q8Y5_PSEPJ|nr:hypothetical protein PPERSA_00295 [Pseudocohnilembus persalinus]|eukprot:KRW98707.1 hypothetical protein PPERSA_00295 [Pseudocohnilembus persalinus]
MNSVQQDKNEFINKQIKKNENCVHNKQNIPIKQKIDDENKLQQSQFIFVRSGLSKYCLRAEKIRQFFEKQELLKNQEETYQNEENEEKLQNYQSSSSSLQQLEQSEKTDSKKEENDQNKNGVEKEENESKKKEKEDENQATAQVEEQSSTEDKNENQQDSDQYEIINIQKGNQHQNQDKNVISYKNDINNNSSNNNSLLQESDVDEDIQEMIKLVDKDYILKVLRTSQEYIDSPLHDMGIQQCLHNQEIYDKLDIHTVFISPLLRSLQTAYYLFINNPNKENIKFKVLPIISDIMRNSCSISNEVNLKPREFFQNCELKFDFSEFDEGYQIPSLWQIEQLQDQNIKQQLTTSFWQCEEQEQFRKTIVKQIGKIYPQNLESYSCCVQRAQKAKKFLLNYKNNLIKQNQKIVIISHEPFLKCLTCEKPQEIGYLEEDQHQQYQWCKPVPYQIIEIDDD